MLRWRVTSKCNWWLFVTEEVKLAYVWGSISHSMSEQQPPASAEPAFV